MKDDQDKRATQEGARRPEFTWLDVLAFSIAAFQIILPVVLMFFGVMVVIYFIFRLVLR